MAALLSMFDTSSITLSPGKLRIGPPLGTAANLKLRPRGHARFVAMAALLSMFLLAATTVAAAAAVSGGTPPSPSPGRPQPMQQLLDHVRAIPGAFVGWTPQVSFVNNPDGSIGFCFQCQPLATDSRGEYCMTTNSSGR